MFNYKLHWEEASEEARKAVFDAYLLTDNEFKANWQEANENWKGCNFYTIKYTFAPAGYWG